MSERTRIGVFDSGFGGLTVLHALAEALPGADFVYLGDTARLPYGSKSAATVTKYTGAAVELLRARGAELVVIACNTASALALPTLMTEAKVPLVGVIEPGAAEAARVLAGAPQGLAGGPALVLATEATVASHAYRTACAAHGVEAFEKACPLLVPMVEEGWNDHGITAQTAYIYLRDALDAMRAEREAISDDLLARSGMLEEATEEARQPALVLLGCTHYPLLRPLLLRTIASVMDAVPVVDSSTATAEHVRARMPELAVGEGESTMTFLATDSPAKFKQLGERFLQRAIPDVELVSLDT